MEGSKWEKKLRYIVYDDNGKEVSNGTYSDLHHLVCLLSFENPQIKTICCLATRLQSYNRLKQLFGGCSTFKIFQVQLRHHFIEIETHSGDFYTLEKVNTEELSSNGPKSNGNPTPSFTAARLEM